MNSLNQKLTPQVRSSSFLRGTILLVPEGQTLMGMLLTEQGQTLYFEKKYYQENPNSDQYFGEVIKTGDQVIFKAEQLSLSVWRPVEFYNPKTFHLFRKGAQ